MLNGFTRRYEDPGQCDLDALPELLAPWNVWIAAREPGLDRAPSAAGLEAVVLADLALRIPARELLTRIRDALGQTEVPIVALTVSAAAERRASSCRPVPTTVCRCRSSQPSCGRASRGSCKSARACAGCKR